MGLVPPQLHQLAWSKCLELLWSESLSVWFIVTLPNTILELDKPILEPRIVSTAESAEIIKDFLDAYGM